MEGTHTEAVWPRRQDTGLPGTADLPERLRCAAIIAADPTVRAAGLQAAATSLAEAGAVSVRVGNPLSSALTLRRILVQIDLDGSVDDAGVDDEAHLIRLLEERRGAQERIVLVVERAETLDTTALLSLQRLAGAPGAVQVLFVGAPTFWALLDGAGLAPLRRALTGQGTEPVAPPPPPVPVVAYPEATARPAVGTISDRSAGITIGSRPVASARSGRRWWMVGAVASATTFALGVAAALAPGGLFYYAAPQRDMPTHLDVAAGPEQPPAASRPGSPRSSVVLAPAAPPPPQVAAQVVSPTLRSEPPVPQAPAAPSLAARAGGQQTRPRSEPVQLPNAPGHGADALPDPQRDAQPGQPEPFPPWQARDAASPTTPSSSGARVVIHYLGGSGAGAAEADRLAGAAASLATRVQTRMVADTPSAPVIRFFHPEDAARARQLAGALGGPGPRWDVRDFGDFRPKPSLGTIEIWTPVR